MATDGDAGSSGNIVRSGDARVLSGGGSRKTSSGASRTPKCTNGSNDGAFNRNLLLPENFYCSWRNQSRETFLIRTPDLGATESQLITSFVA